MGQAPGRVSRLKPSSWLLPPRIPIPMGWHAGTVRVLANALLVLLAFEVVMMVGVVATIVAGTIPVTPDELVPGVTISVTPVELVPLAAAFYLVRWAFVLPGLLPVLVGIEYIARRAPHARVLTAIVAFAPMALWELSKTPGDFPSEFGAVLGVTAMLFTVLARLPARFQGRSPEDRGAAQPPAGAAVAPHRVLPTHGCRHAPSPGTPQGY